ncbi:aldehyde dehydrogenase family protein [Mycolicibacterium stellerae]|uniref:aldehyde dehydrogenase family protein n=1 Tax=Mycolicibacterium stellerae TaxID=2358193 RepID=UPI000F0B7D78|nr:aldehyde dehydrogenase family protein [Mycolicibacterium stellerae]
MIAIDALGPTGVYRSRNRELITDSEGVVVAELTVAPKLYVARAVNAQRRTRPLAIPQRQVALLRAADAFVNARVCGLDFDAYVQLASRVSGLPIAAARQGAREVADGLTTAFDALRPARPTGATPDWRDQRHEGGAVWARRGDVFGVLASGNAPGVHALWPQALALGYRVAVRPSRREPFTGYRLVHALRQSGFRDQDALYLPTDYAGADELVACADLAMVYGGQDVVDRYADDPTVLVNGPGRSKILITDDRDWRDYLDVIVDSIAHLGGMACVNATAVLCEHDAPALARAIAERLSSIAPLPITDDRAVLPTQPLAEARALADHVAAKATGTTAVLGADQVVADLGGGHAALRPAVHLLARPEPEILNTELAFPCVWVSPWTRDDGIAPLRNSLVVTALTGDEALIDELVAEPTIANVYSGRCPTYYTAPGIPHDGFLADFLMRCKGFARLD